MSRIPPFLFPSLSVDPRLHSPVRPKTAYCLMGSLSLQWVLQSTSSSARSWMHILSRSESPLDTCSLPRSPDQCLAASARVLEKAQSSSNMAPAGTSPSSWGSGFRFGGRAIASIAQHSVTPFLMTTTPWLWTSSWRHNKPGSLGWWLVLVFFYNLSVWLQAPSWLGDR